MKLITAALSLTVLSGSTLAQPLHTALYSNEVTAPATSTMPGGGVFESFQRLAVSPNGQHSVMIARRVNASYRDYAVIRDPAGASQSVIIRSGDLLPAPYATLRTLRGTSSATEGIKLTELSINDSGAAAFQVRSDGAGPPAAPRHVLLRHAPVAGFSVLKTGGEVLAGLFNGPQPGASPAVGFVNDSNFAASFSGVNMLADGTAAFQANDIVDDGTGGITATGVSNHFGAFTSNADAPEDVLNQQGVTQITGSFGYLFGHTGGTLRVSPDGANWIMRGNQFWNVAGNTVLIRNNTLLFQVGDEIPGLPGEFIANTSTAIGSTIAQDPLGNWYAPVVGTNQSRVLLRNGVIVAQSGAPITPGNTTTYITNSGGFLAVPSPDGQYCVIGTTLVEPERTTRVLVLNGQQVIATVGDKVDVNRDGLDNDDRVIRAFSFDTTAFVGTSKLLVGVTLGTAANDSVVGDAILEINLTPVAPVARCNGADIAYDNGDFLPRAEIVDGTNGTPAIPGPATGTNNGVTEADYNVFFANFFDANSVADIANDDGTTRVPTPAPGTIVNNGVTEGDYNYFFSVFFDGCSL